MQMTLYFIDYFLMTHCLADASSSNESFVLQQRLKSLSTELVTLRNRLHVTGSTSNGGGIIGGCANFSTQNAGKANVINVVAFNLRCKYQANNI